MSKDNEVVKKLLTSGGTMISCEPSGDMGKRLKASGITCSFLSLCTMKKSNSLMLRHQRASLLCCGFTDVSHIKFVWSVTTFVCFPSMYGLNCLSAHFTPKSSICMVCHLDSVSENACDAKRTGLSLPSTSWVSIAPTPHSEASVWTLNGRCQSGWYNMAFGETIADFKSLNSFSWSGSQTKRTPLRNKFRRNFVRSAICGI